MDRLLVYKKTNGRCWYCGRKMNINAQGILNHIPEEAKYQDGITRHNFSVDHIIPNGSNDIDNLVPCCKGCNSAKSTRPLEHFRKIMWSRKFKNRFGISFTPEQLDFLDKHGLELPMEKGYSFYFERKGL